MYVATGRAAAAEQYLHFLQSIYAGTIHLFRKLQTGDISSIIAKFRKSISDEPILSATIGHFKVVRALNLSGARALTERYPNYTNKYASDYLVRSFGRRARREVLKFHHQYLAKYVTPFFYHTILNGGETLWCETIDGSRYAISILFNHQFHSEGDVSLSFDKDGLALYAISFTIVPGEIIGCSSEQAMLIAVIQGQVRQAEAIRISTKACHDIAPPYLLLAATLSIAEVLGIDIVAGVNNKEQISKSRKDTVCYFDYDAFWETLSVKRNGMGFYEGSIPLPDKPIEQVVSKHRGRVRLKRRLRKEIADHVGAAFAKFFLKPTDQGLQIPLQSFNPEANISRRNAKTKDRRA